GSDPSYTLIAGNDNYPEIFIGRFSAQNVNDMQTQVHRTIYYERDIQAGSDWVQKAMGIASNEGGGSQGDMGESDQQHLELIRTDLLNYGYISVDQVYQTQGATAAQVTNFLHQGRGFINYTGHGSNTSWSTTGFSNTHVNALTNDYMLPFIVSVACVNGNFVSMTCFAEAWLMATNNTNGNPTGAISHYASTINQSWNPPMRAQDEIVDLLIAESKQTIGGLFFNGSSRMTEVYGTGGADMFKTWHIFGDASLVVRSKDPLPLTANYTPVLFLGVGTFEVNTVPGAKVALSHNGTLLGVATANSTGLASVVLPNPPQEPMDITVTITAFNRVTHIGTLQVLPSTGPYVVVNQVLVGDDNTAEYGELVNLNLVLNNVGSDLASDVNIVITSTDPYLTIITTEEN
ncbi:MAG: C25 family cysteine peptidase, partial [Candidatus Cloacimonadaceae bacterium]|nr:C25 family cysteine peptidase [Candidatus Cloacimonadaceae bacterium]